MKKILALALAATVLFGVLCVLPAKARAQEGEGGPTKSEGRPGDEPLLDELRPEEDRFEMENEEIPSGAYAQTGVSEASISIPFIAKISIVLVVLVAVLVIFVLRGKAAPTS